MRQNKVKKCNDTNCVMLQDRNVGVGQQKHSASVVQRLIRQKIGGIGALKSKK